MEAPRDDRDGPPARPPRPQPRRGWTPPLWGMAARRRVYLVLMGSCVLLIVLAWTLIWRYSAVAAVAMSAVALCIPPVATIIANSGPVNRQ